MKKQKIKIHKASSVQVCQHCQNDFTISEGEFSLYEKVGIELPTLCFFCRIKLHLSFWMFGKFRKGKSDLSGDSLITVLPQNSRYPIYTLTEWYSDKWDPMDYGMDYDERKPFLSSCKVCRKKFLILIKMVAKIPAVIGVTMCGIVKIATFPGQ